MKTNILEIIIMKIILIKKKKKKIIIVIIIIMLNNDEHYNFKNQKNIEAFILIYTSYIYFGNFGNVPTLWYFAFFILTIMCLFLLFQVSRQNYAEVQDLFRRYYKYHCNHDSLLFTKTNELQISEK